VLNAVKRIVRERCAFSPDSGLTCVTSVHNIPENKKLPQDIWNQNRFCPISGSSCVDIVRAHQVHTFYLLPDCTSAAEISVFSGKTASPKMAVFQGCL